MSSLSVSRHQDLTIWLREELKSLQGVGQKPSQTARSAAPTRVSIRAALASLRNLHFDRLAYRQRCQQPSRFAYLLNAPSLWCCVGRRSVDPKPLRAALQE